MKLKFKKDGRPGNAIDIALEEAQGSKASLEYVHGGSDLVTAREQFKGENIERADYVQSTVDSLLKPRFLVIVKNASLTLPEANVDGKTFKGGSVEFEVYAFDMQENKELGMVKGSAQSGSSVLARTNYTQNSDQDLKTSMAMDAAVAYGMLMKPFEE